MVIRPSKTLNQISITGYTNHSGSGLVMPISPSLVSSFYKKVVFIVIIMYTYIKTSCFVHSSHL